jgi:S-adenosyl methyltransferase
VTAIPDSPGPPPAAIDQTAPNAARIYDWLIGGKDNYDADRQAARRLLRAVPEARQAARDNRAYLGRAVRWLARQGIDQFIDIGSGLPSVSPVHETARKVRPDARVAYIDRPVAVMLVAVAHFLAADDHPGDIIQVITDRVAPGSYLAISHVTAADITPEAQKAARAAYAGASPPVQPRTRAEVTRLLAGLDIVPPGITDVRAWRRPGRHNPPVPPVMFWAGAARVPGPRHPGQPPAERSSPP